MRTQNTWNANGLDMCFLFMWSYHNRNAWNIWAREDASQLMMTVNSPQKFENRPHIFKISYSSHNFEKHKEKINRTRNQNRMHALMCLSA